jgi:hypothetical protein
MRKVALLTLALMLAVFVLSCRHKNKNKDARYSNGTYGEAPPPAPAPTSNDASAGTCDNACQHYLACKGVNDPTTHNQCVNKCVQAGYKTEVLANFIKTDCASAIFIVEGQGNTGGGTGGATTAKECQGCVWDGSSCIWMSSSNWGSGPYSGAWTACNAACCPGH